MFALTWLTRTSLSRLHPYPGCCGTAQVFVSSYRQPVRSPACYPTLVQQHGPRPSHAPGMRKGPVFSGLFMSIPFPLFDSRSTRTSAPTPSPTSSATSSASSSSCRCTPSTPGSACSSSATSSSTSTSIPSAIATKVTRAAAITSFCVVSSPYYFPERGETAPTRFRCCSMARWKTCSLGYRLVV